MNRVIDIALWALMAILALAVAVGVSFTSWAVTLDKLELVLEGVRTVLLELGGLVVVAAVYSIRKRLAAIELKLNER